MFELFFLLSFFSFFLVAYNYFFLFFSFPIFKVIILSLITPFFFFIRHIVSICIIWNKMTLERFPQRTSTDKWWLQELFVESCYDVFTHLPLTSRGVTNCVKGFHGIILKLVFPGWIREEPIHPFGITLALLSSQWNFGRKISNLKCGLLKRRLRQQQSLVHF